jgi:pimeloyl-ACP methyl ester carboxylesterase/membrane protein DedA with SNARE-associated domain
MTRRRIILGLFLMSLVASNVYRALQAKHHSDIEVAARGMQSVSVQLESEAPVTIAYRVYGDADAPVVIALHGSPAASGFATVAPALADDFRVLVPHLPGFGASTPRIPDYSIAAHAVYVQHFMNALNIPSAHFIGYSMGSGVALSLYDLQPERVKSLTLLSAIGVQELEMFGNYHLNHVVHGAQLAGLWLLENALPHFGLLDRAMLNTRYARNFYDTDQRPLRAILERFEPPLLILHGDRDPLVPYAAALEHERIVPQSRLVTFDGGHGLNYRARPPVNPALLQFLRDAQNALAPNRSKASATRLARAAEPLSDHVQVSLSGLALILALITLCVSTLISEDATCIAAGLLVAGGIIEFWPAAIACLIGIYLGDAMLFFAGRHLGAPALSRAPLRWFVSADGLESGKAWFAKRGPATIVISRFVPGTRLPTYLAAGALGQGFVRFSLWFLLASILWTPALVAISATAGSAVGAHFDQFSTYALPVLLAVIVSMMIVLRVVLPLATYRGRRLMLGRWRRLTRWEFWPRWAFYPPLVVYILYLGVRYRSPTLFTAANPAMPHGGVMGESKRDILEALSAHSVKFVATTATLPEGDARQRMHFVSEFMQRHDLSWPVVLKPDVGERGSDVRIANAEDDVAAYLEQHSADTLVQAFAPGQEFGVFYVRLPDDEHGRIFAITDKRPPQVTGDGLRDLEQLILDDERAVCMAPTIMRRQGAALHEVPAAGEIVTLVDVGTHSQGCVFLDGDWIRSPELAQVIDEISRDYEGFYFGRYDIRTPNIDDFRRGENFKIVELNGVTSEATNIYDPKNSLFKAYKVLAQQWRLAFEIGRRNRDRGAPVTSVSALARSILATRRADGAPSDN